MGFFNKDVKSENVVSDVRITDAETNTNKRLYLVDYENVSDAGLVGIDQLSCDDIVVIFYGSKVKSVAYESLIAITNSTANIEHVKVEKTAKNYLDFQLTTYLGYKLGKHSYDEIYVISRDSGFDAVIDFWKSKGYSIIRQVSIVVKEIDKEKTEHKPTAGVKQTKTKKSKSKTTTRPTVTDKQKAELRAALKGAQLSAPEYKKVYDAFSSSENALAYNNKLQKSLGNEKTSIVYKATSKIFTNSKKQIG